LVCARDRGGPGGGQRKGAGTRVSVARDPKARRVSAGADKYQNKSLVRAFRSSISI
jgi:hypothetical protein